MNRSVKTALGTVIYGNNKDFLQDFIRSINRQNDQEFDLLIINDGVEEDAVKYLRKSVRNHLFIMDADRGNKPYQNRIGLLRLAKSNSYELLILADYDDIMSANRVYEYKCQYDKNYALFYNNLKINTGQNVFRMLPAIVKWGDILEYNFLGLSNTGLNLNQLEDAFVDSLAAGDTQIFDWYLFDRVLLGGKIGKRIDRACTEYRIYEDNIAGIQQDIQKEIEVKCEHYLLLRDYHAIYPLLLQMYSQVDVYHLGNVTKNGYWWENIKLLEENVKNEVQL